MFKVQAVYALMLGVLLAAVVQAQQTMPPGMIQGPMMLPPTGGPAMGGPAGPAFGGPAMGGPMMGGPMQGGPMPSGPMMGGPMQQPMVAPVNFESDFGVQQAGFSGGGCGPGCFDGGCGMGCGGCGHGCGLCDGMGCGVCCPPPGCPVIFNGEVEATFLVPDLDGNLATGGFASPTVPALALFSSLDAELDEGEVLPSPRIWLHAQKCEWGIGARLWYLDGASHDLTPFNLLALNIFGDMAQERLYLLNADVEATYSWHTCHGAGFQWGVGLRYVDMQHSALAFGSAVLDDVIATTNAVAISEYEGYGVTTGVRGTIPVYHNVNIFWNLRGTYSQGDLMARVQTAATAVGDGDAAAATTSAGAITDDDLLIGEAQLGVQWEHALACLPARAFCRFAFEYQHWEFDNGVLATSTAQADVATVPGTIATANATAAARDPRLDLYGLSIAAGLTW